MRCMTPTHHSYAPPVRGHEAWGLRARDARQEWGVCRKPNRTGYSYPSPSGEGGGHGDRRRREANVIRTTSWARMSVAVLVIGGARPVPGYETDLSGWTPSDCLPFRKALECVGKRGVVEWGGKPGDEEGAGAKHRERSFRYRRSARGWRVICLMVNENCHRSGSKTTKGLDGIYSADPDFFPQGTAVGRTVWRNRQIF